MSTLTQPAQKLLQDFLATARCGHVPRMSFWEDQEAIDGIDELLDEGIIEAVFVKAPSSNGYYRLTKNYINQILAEVDSR